MSPLWCICHQEWFYSKLEDCNHSKWEFYNDFIVSRCARCHKEVYWEEKSNSPFENYYSILFPDINTIENPNDDMPDGCKELYEEAREVFNKSPKGSCALLRLLIQKLMVELGEKGENIKANIDSLVKKGLNPNTTEMLNFCRVIGNNAVHPGIISIDDNPDIAKNMFKVINYIISETITRKKNMDQIIENLPDSVKEKIRK